MPNKKVFDIIPPKESGEPIGPVRVRQPSQKPEKPGFFEKLNKKKKTAAIKPVFPKPPRAKINFDFIKRIMWWPVLTVLGLVFIFGASYFLIKPKVEIDVWPVKTPLNLKTQVLVSASSQGAAGIVSGEIKTYEHLVTQDFPTTGVRANSTKASGKIVVYNAYSTSDQSLIADTRFVSDNGKLFRTPVRIVVPGAHYEGSKLIPGEIEITVVAGEAGEEYNIGPSTFSIPGLAGTPRYTAFYAKSFGSMTGGAEAETVMVTKKDIEGAEEILSSRALQEAKKALADSLSSENYIMEDDALTAEVSEVLTLAKEGQEVESFSVQAKAEATAIVFKKEELEKFAQSYVSENLPEGKLMDENSLAISYLPKSVDLKNGKILLDVEISAEIYPLINENAIKEAVKNKRSEEIPPALNQFSEIEKSQARLWPFWANRAPLETGSIAVKLRLD